MNVKPVSIGQNLLPKITATSKKIVKTSNDLGPKINITPEGAYERVFSDVSKGNVVDKSMGFYQVKTDANGAYVRVK